MTDIDAITARAEAATEGPWEVVASGWSGKDLDTISSPSENIVMPQDEQGGSSWARDADAEFIAHARQDIPELLAELKKLSRFKTGYYTFEEYADREERLLAKFEVEREKARVEVAALRARLTALEHRAGGPIVIRLTRWLGKWSSAIWVRDRAIVLLHQQNEALAKELETARHDTAKEATA